MHTHLASFVLVSLLIATPAASQVVLEPFIVGLDHPVQIVAAHDRSEHLLVAQQNGQILSFDGGRPSSRTFLDLRPIVSCCDNGGLLSLVFHPRYSQNGHLFVLYVDLNGDTAVARYSRSINDPEVADPSSGQILLSVPQPKDNLPNHHGGALQFGPDGFLYISIGDGGAVQVTSSAQELHHVRGKLLRIDVDGTAPYEVPADNPYFGIAGTRGEIWSHGLRNPWRFTFDRLTGDLMIGDVGQDAWEEIDILSLAQARGANFGWPLTEATHCFPSGSSCDINSITLPQLEYGRELGCSVTGGYRYRGSHWPRLAGRYIYADWCSGRIWAATEESEDLWTSMEVARTGSAIVSFGEDDAGELYIVDYNGSIFRLTAPTARKRAIRR